MATEWKTIDAFKPGIYECERCGTNNEFVAKLDSGEFACIDCLEEHEWLEKNDELPL